MTESSVCSQAEETETQHSGGKEGKVSVTSGLYSSTLSMEEEEERKGQQGSSTSFISAWLLPCS